MRFLNVGAASRECNGSLLRHDHGCLELHTPKDMQFYMQYAGCEGCKLQLAANLTANVSQEMSLSSLWPVRWKLHDPIDGADYCNESSYPFGEYGRYVINGSDCAVHMTAEPDAAYLPLLETAVTLLALATVWYVVKAAHRRLREARIYARFVTREDNELGNDTATLVTPRSPTRSRLRSLDIFRGMSIALMIFVNQGGGGYAALSHAEWNGLTVADLVFPCFAWVMGASLVLSLNARLRTATPRLTALSQVARRSLYLALIGIVLGAQHASLETVRLPGVLQRLAVAYLVVGALECACVDTRSSIIPGNSLIRDLASGWKQWLGTLILAAIQVCVSLLVAAPGCPVGYAGPGGLHMSEFNQSLQNCTGGIAAYIDKTVLGAQHIYHGGSYRSLYRTTSPHDPEGLLGCLTAVLVVQAGAHSCRIMLRYNHARARVMRLVGWSLLLGLSGGALCGFKQDGGAIPINKNLWSLSYCLVSAGVAFAVQAVLYVAVDLKAKWGGRPFYYAGQNALTLYVLSVLLHGFFPLRWPLLAPTHAQLLFTHLGTTLAYLAVAVALHRKRIFISL